MKVLLASDTYYPHVNGASYFTQRLAEALAERGHEVAVISPSETIGNDTKIRKNVKLFGVRSFPVLIVPKFRFVLPLLINARIKSAITEFKPDIVHIQMHFPVSRAALNAARKLNIPVVATNHFMPENLTHYLPVPQFVKDAIHHYAWLDAARVYYKTQGVTAPTKTASDMLVPWYSKEVPAISNGIDLKRFNKNVDPKPAKEKYALPDKPAMIFVGRLDKEKNVDVTIRAFAEARKSSDFQLIIAGHGAEENKLKKLAEKLGVSRNVTFAGFVPDELLPSLYANAVCYVNAGIAELQCIAAMEGMATGLAVIGARAVALPELIHDGENGYLFEPGNVNELASRMAEVMNDDAKRKAFGEESLRIIAHHDIDMTLEAFEEFYRKAIAAER